ncbi:hypothetical protein EH165_11280 [Nakamurella antarctica]|uniref:Uncharacterized protein n=1 Tax=Nakamurella antarctica TaxID=1902245 RepID=A0A3G8ZMT1_9ACTN|nr:hypothetical protein [Nakamurella antarctica]AZI58629.1 hypothetical protein EH165_11280 [Nakamurella antarctica]
MSLPGGPSYPLSSIRPAVPVLGWTLWVKTTSQDQRTDCGATRSTVMYVQQESDSYLSYGLLGGP